MPEHDEIREQMAAWLAAELDDAAAADLEAQVADDPALAAELDALAETMVLLTGADEVEPPEGYGARLRAGLAAGIGHDLPPAHQDVPAPGRAPSPPPSRGSRRPGPSRPGAARQPRLRRLSAVVSGLAVVAVLAVGTLVVTRGGFGGDDAATGAGEAVAQDDGGARDEAAADLAEEPTQDFAVEDAPREEAAAAPAPTGADDDAADDAADTEATALAESDAAGSAPVGPEVVGPAVVDSGVRLDDPDDVAAHFTGRPAVEALLGLDRATAADLAQGYRAEVERSPAFADGQAPGACLATVLADADATTVPAVAERVTTPEGAAVAYALVRARADSEVLDEVAVWVVDDACAVVHVVGVG